MRAVETWIWAAPLVASAATMFMVLNQWAVRRARFGAIGVRHSLRAMLTVAVQVLAGIRSHGAGGLLLGLGVGHAAGAAVMLRGSGLGGPKAWVGSRPIRVLREFKGACFRLSIAALFNIRDTQVPLLIFSAAYPASVVGWLGLTQRTLALPVTVIGTAVAQVFVSAAASRARTGGQLRALFGATSRRLAVLAAGLALVVASGRARSVLLRVRTCMGACGTIRSTNGSRRKCPARGGATVPNPDSCR